MENITQTFNPDTVHEIFKLTWNRTAKDPGTKEDAEDTELEAGAGVSKKNRSTTANTNALKLSCELLRLFVTEAIQRAALVAEVEGLSEVEGTHLERILPQLLLDF